MSKDILYRDVGAAIHLAQALELNISTLISIMNRHYSDHLDQTPFVVGNDKRTLGRLIKAIQKRATMDDAGAEALGKALKSRNYLAHEFFTRSTGAFEDNELCVKAIALCEKHAKQVAIGTAISSAFVQSFCEALKIPQSDVLIRQDI